MNKKTLMLISFLISGTIAPFMKFTPHWVITSPFFRVSRSSIVLFIALTFATIILSVADIILVHLIYSIIFVFGITIGYSIISRLEMKEIYDVLNKFISFQAASCLIFHVAPIEAVIIFRKIFVNSFYLENPQILRQSGILPEPSDHYLFLILAITFSILLKKRLPYFRIFIVAITVQSLSLALLVPALLIRGVPEFRDLTMFSKTILLILGVGAVTVITSFALSGLELDASDASRIIWISIGINAIFEPSLPAMSFAGENYIRLIPETLKPLSGVLLERDSISTVPNSPGTYLLIFYRQLGFMIFIFFLYNIVRIKQDMRMFLISAYTFFTVFLVQSPVLVPFWIFLYAKRPLDNNLQP